MKPGTEIRVAVRALDQEGAGVGELVGVVDQGDAIQVHVPGALPEEEVSARVNQVSAHRPMAWASLRAIHRASRDRVTPACSAYGRCGGCPLQHLDVRAQLDWKAESLRRLVAADPVLGGVAVAAAVASPLSLGYRNNSKLVAGRDHLGHPVLGAYAPRSHDLVDLAGCAVVEPPLATVATVLGQLIADLAIEPYDEIRLVGTLRYVILRANAHGQVLVTLVTATDGFTAGDVLGVELRTRCPEVVGVVQNVNPTRGNALYGARERILLGDATFLDQIGDVRVRISSRAFFQANRRVARAAYQAIAASVAPTGRDTVVDAYAGVGGIALTLAGTAGDVIGIEEHPGAVEDATWSATLNGIANATFRSGDVAEHLGSIGAANAVVLNPPRKGCAPTVLQQAAALRPRVIAYLSCAPATLLRDLAVLSGLGYRTVGITPFDMLPHTAHLEALAILIA